MDTKRKDAAARMAVTKLLKRFSDTLTTRLAAGTAEFWNSVEQRLAQKSPGQPAGHPSRRPRHSNSAYLRLSADGNVMPRGPLVLASLCLEA